ncbi:hypothetical protein RhiJN_12294 [Ceratobasidium sp. AG-Ba]|nr:hypothetical protein RhiJN_12294 [Ceratobasidium sp. AG-Ba]QRW12907.1 hypothetical protein RhiLY_11906 [Ceratobasidium sp. AG-Ba]
MHPSFGIILAISLAGFAIGAPANFGGSAALQSTGWVNRPSHFEELGCGHARFEATKVIDVVSRAAQLEGNRLKEKMSNGHEYPRTLESSRVEGWYNWPRAGNKDTRICGDKNGEVVLYPIFNAKSVGPYRVVISKNYNLRVNEKNRQTMRIYAFCGLAVHSQNSYRMCNNYQRENLDVWEFEDKTGQVALCPISNTKPTGWYRVAVSKKYRLKVDEETGKKIREYAFCGLAVRTDSGYKMCNRWQRQNSTMWDAESEEDLDEELELSEFDY